MLLLQERISSKRGHSECSTTLLEQESNAFDRDRLGLSEEEIKQKRRGSGSLASETDKTHSRALEKIIPELRDYVMATLGVYGESAARGMKKRVDALSSAAEVAGARLKTRELREHIRARAGRP